MSCDPNQLISNARCLLQCIPPGLQPSAQTAMLDLVNGGPTPTNTLLQDGKEFVFRIPPRMQTAIQIYLLLVVLRGQKTVDELLQLASCMRCIPAGLIPGVQTYQVCQWSEGGTGACNNPIVLDWLQRMANNGVTLPSAGTIRAVCDFCNGLDAAGLTDKMLVVNPVIPDSLSSMRYPLIWQPANGLSPWLNNGFVNVDLTVDGIGASFSATYLDTGFIPSTHWTDTPSAGISIYGSDDFVGAPEAIDGGCDDGVGGLFWISAYDDSAPGMNAICWNAASQILPGTVYAPAFYSLNRTSNVLLSLYGKSPFVLQGSSAANQVGVPIPDISVYFMAVNEGGVANRFNGRRLSFMAIHEGLTSTEVLEFYNLVQTFRMQLGGGWS